MQKSLPVHVEVDDLIHAGVIGLFDAVRKYQGEKQVAFATYAQHRIRGAMLDGLRQQDRASRDLRRRYKELRSVTQELSASLQRVPTESEVAAAMGIDCEKLRGLQLEFRGLEQLDRWSSDGARQDCVPREIPIDPVEHPDQIAARREIREKLRSVMGILPQRHRQVVELYYEHDLTMRQIGAALGVNESRVSQIHKAALSRMQQAFCDAGVYSSAALC